MNLNKKLDVLPIHKYDLMAMVFLRSVLFVMVASVVIFALVQIGDLRAEVSSRQYWPLQMITGNLVTIAILAYILKQEKKSYLSLYGAQKSTLKKDILIGLALLIPAFLITMAGMALFGLILYGGSTPEYMFSRQPLAIATISLLLFPITNLLAEGPLYLGFSLNRFLANKQRIIPWVMLCAFGFALQHSFLPLVFDFRYILWRLLGFLPLTIAMAWFYVKYKRLVPLAVMHFLMDLALAAIVLFMSLN